MTASPARRRANAATLLALLAVFTLFALFAFSPTPALARTRASVSTNWSGYAVREDGVRFRAATASWRQPSASCTSGAATYSSFWVGIGGYSTRSDALEQIGTELDCTRGGTSRSRAWYELVPAASHAIHLTIEPGDLIDASVTVVGTRVTLVLVDRTRGERFARTLTDDAPDLSSAEWIAEAPSDCQGSNCTVLPLTDFASATFLGAGATTTQGVTRSLAAAPWIRERLTLTASGGGDGDGRPGLARAAVSATPSALSGSDGGFTVTYGTG